MGAQGEEHDAERLRRDVDNLHTALASRDVIGQAKGILMERHGIGADEAFDRLVRISQETNTKLRAVAAGIIGTGSASATDAATHDDGGEQGDRERTSAS